MHAASNYVIRMATDEDEDDLARLAALDSSRPLEGTSTAAELPPTASAAAWAIASSVAARDRDCPSTEAIR